MARKPRTKKVITEEIIDTEPEVLAEPEFIDDPDGDLLESRIAEFGGQSGVKVKLQRITSQGQAEYLQTYPNATARVDEVDEAFIQRSFGGGRYNLRFYRDGRLVYVHTCTIADDPNGQASPANPNGPRAGDPMMQMLLDDRKMMMEALFNRRDSTPVGELAQAVSVITANKQAEPSLGDKMFEIFMKGFEMANRTNGGESSEGGWLGFAKDMGKQLAPAILPAVAGLLGGAGGQQNAPAQPSGGVAGGIPQEAVRMLQMGIGYLKKKALAGKDPAFYVDFVLENRDEEMYANLIGLICQSDFAQIAALDPQIGQEPYHAFFVGIYNGIRQAIAEEQQAQREDAMPEVLADAPDAGLYTEVKPNGKAAKPLDVDTAGAVGDARNPANNGGSRPRRGK